MKMLVMIGLLLSPTLAVAASHRQSDSDVYVQGHTRSNGTYVEPYYRSAPNANRWDNYGYTPSQPQYNPSANDPNRGSDWNTPNPGRLNDNNPYNDAPGYGRQ
jgi:hypothetical protein